MENITYVIQINRQNTFKSDDYDETVNSFQRMKTFIQGELSLLKVTEWDFINHYEATVQGILQTQLKVLGSNPAVCQIAMSKVRFGQKWKVNLTYTEVLECFNLFE